ncbi:hypothetical protein LMG26858_02317 [Achromobacter anxifer]|uniref:Uncharacterized protein n=1 Tax=Achromobacter anxifer TaxID=1287737 RepID=A0A6S7DMN6_9BURK|nr:hypothetical protein [Achromobacter anxifer]CAB3862946.1 hypothetical protein LMG26858_02317 [Achromobacter anxifer]
MDVRGKGDAAQATMALLKLAKEIADHVVGDADQATVRAVFDRLCMETDDRAGVGPAPAAPASMH